MRVLGFVTLLSLHHVCLGQVPQCYYSTGAKASNAALAINDVPCNPDASNSTCCGAGYICGTNLYCFDQQGHQILGSCTDKSWQSVDCPLPIPVDQYFNFNNVTNCSDGTICPNSNNQSCCAARKGVELISYHNTAIIPTPTDDLSAYYANAGYSIPVTASAHSSSASNSLSMTITGATSASVKTLQTSTSSSSSSGLNKGASAGTGVGAALGVLIVGAAVILFIYKRKRKSGVAEKHLPATMIVRG